MALTLSASTDRIDYANFPASATGTICIWCKTTAGSTRQQLCFHDGGSDTQIEFNLSGANNIGFYKERATTYCSCVTTPTNFAAFGANKWLFVVWRWDTNGAATDQKGMIGDLNIPAAEPSSYTTQSAGSGAVNTTTGNFRMGNNATPNRPFIGSIAWAGRWNRMLSLPEIWDVQRYGIVHPAGNILDATYGDVPGAQINRSSLLIHGVVTGAVYGPSQELDTILYQAPASPIWGRRAAGGVTTTPAQFAAVLTGQGTRLDFGINMPLDQSVS